MIPVIGVLTWREPQLMAILIGKMMMMMMRIHIYIHIDILLYVMSYLTSCVKYTHLMYMFLLDCNV